MHHEDIELFEKDIFGVAHPLLQVQGRYRKKFDDIKIIVDGKEIEYKLIIDQKKSTFFIHAFIMRHAQEVKVIAVYDKDEYIITTINNVFFDRLIKKVQSLLRICAQLFKRIWSWSCKAGRGIKKIWRVLVRHHFILPPSLLKKYIQAFFERIHNHSDSIVYDPFNPIDYKYWLEKNEDMSFDLEALTYKPLISIVIPVYNIERKYLTECLESILNQSYQNFEICIADDCSTNPETLETLKEYEKKDKIKIIYREKNGHISEATNSALSLAKGEFIGLCDNDDILTSNALYENVKALNQNSNLDLIYSDEDKIDMEYVRKDPNFKSDFALDSLLSSNYFCHFTVIRKSIIDEIGGYRKGYEGAQDYDLFLRVVEKTKNIHHIPKILYHWRMIPGSTAATIDSKGYAVERGRQALQDFLDRQHIHGSAKIHERIPMYYMDYHLDGEPSVSIVIPTKDLSETLKICLDSIYEKTTYQNYEIIVVNNNSVEEKTFELFKDYMSNHNNFRVVDAMCEFNFSKINNLAVKTSSAEYIVLLNNDTEVINGDWLRVMISYAAQPHIGAVGAKLLYPDGTVQHAGVIAGMGIASHYGPNERNDIGLYGRLCVPYNYAAVTAACLAVSRKKYNEVGGLDENLAVSYNDIDFNFKLLKQGYFNVCVPQATLYHYESKSRGIPTEGKKLEQFEEEQRKMLLKWRELIYNDPFYNPNLSRIQAFMLEKIDYALVDPLQHIK